MKFIIWVQIIPRTQNVRIISELADFSYYPKGKPWGMEVFNYRTYFLSSQIWPTFDIIDKISVLKIIENSLINSNYWVW